MQLTPEFAQAFTDLFVHPAPVADNTLSLSDIEQSRAQAAQLYLNEFDIIQRIFEERGPSAVPHLVVHTESESIPQQAVASWDVDGGLHVNVCATEAQNFLHALLGEQATNRISGDELAKQNGYRNINEKFWPREITPSNCVRGRRRRRIENDETPAGSAYDPTWVSVQSGKANTTADLIHYRYISDDERRFWLNYTFLPDNGLDGGKFLRNLRVINGLTAETVSQAIGMQPGMYSKCERGEKHLRLKHCAALLDKNIFKLPTTDYVDRRGREHKVVEPCHARFFAEKFGYAGALHSRPMEDQLISVLHAQHEAVKHRQLKWNELPSLRQVTRRLLRGDTYGLRSVRTDSAKDVKQHYALHAGGKEWQLYEVLPELNDRIGLSALELYRARRLPHVTLAGNCRRSPYTVPHAEECIAIAQEGEMTIGQFLKWYREETGNTQNQVAEKSGKAESYVAQWENSKSLTPHVLGHILETNAYGLPFNGIVEADKNRLKVAIEGLNGTHKERALDKARSTAKTISEYLKIYRKSLHIPKVHVAKAMGCSSHVIENLESNPEKVCSKIELISQKNPYDLPTDDSGELRADVIADLKRFSSHRIEEALIKARAEATNIGNYLKVFREACEDSLEEVAKRAGVNRQAVHVWEKRETLPKGIQTIKETNCYNFPGEANQIRSDVLHDLDRLNTKQNLMWQSRELNRRQQRDNLDNGMEVA